MLTGVTFSNAPTDDLNSPFVKFRPIRCKYLSNWS